MKAKHPAVPELRLEDRVIRLRARLIYIDAVQEARLLGVDLGLNVDDAVNDGIAQMVRDSLKDIDAIQMLPGAVLNTPTPTKGGTR